MILATAVAALLSSSLTQPGIVYHFKADDGTGTVWVVGDDARLEFDPDETKPARGRVQIWKAGGKQRLLLWEQDRTYYDQVAYLGVIGPPTLDTLGVRSPFVIASASKVRVDLLPSPQGTTKEPGGSLVCRPTSLRFSYELSLRLKAVAVSIPARVEGTSEFCLGDSPSVAWLPFGHGLELSSGIPRVDAVLRERLGSLRGVPIKRTLKATRRIEDGEVVTSEATLILSGFQATDVSLDRFEVPKDYRYQEPQIVGPTRQRP